MTKTAVTHVYHRDTATSPRVGEKKERKTAQRSSRKDVASPSWSRSDVTSVCLWRGRKKNMFDDDNQTVVKMMKPPRKQDTVPSLPQSDLRASEGKWRWQIQSTASHKTAFISTPRSPVTKTGLNVLPGFGSFLFLLALLPFNFSFSSAGVLWFHTPLSSSSISTFCYRYHPEDV